MSVLAIGLGKSVLGILLKQMMKNIGLEGVESVPEVLLDSLKSNTEDSYKKRQTALRCEIVANQLAEELEPLYSASAVEDKEAVVLYLTERLKTLRIPAKLLSTPQTSAQEWRNLLIGEAQALKEQGFTEQGEAFYRRLCDHVSQNIVDISHKLPALQEDTFQEVFAHLNTLESSVTQVLAEQKRLREQAGSRESDFDFEYRKQVKRAMDQLRLFGTDLEESSRCYPLEVAYIHLNAYNGQQYLRVNELLQTTRRLVIRGEAGSGKTTLLQWIAVQCADRKFKDGLHEWNAKVPFVIRLREYADKELPNPEDFPKSVASVIAGTMPQDWAHRHLKSGRAVVLIDGVDEVPEKRREAVKTWIGDIINDAPLRRRQRVARRRKVRDSGVGANDG